MEKYILTSCIILMVSAYFFQKSTSALDEHPTKTQISGLNTPYPYMGKQLKAARELRHWSQDSLAQSIGITPNKIEKIEKGTVVPTLEILKKIQDALQCSIKIENWEQHSRISKSI